MMASLAVAAILPQGYNALKLHQHLSRDVRCNDFTLKYVYKMTFLNIMTIAFSWQCNVRKCFGKQSRDGDGPDGASGARA